MSYWEPDDPPELPDGCIDEDTAETLRTLIKHVNIETRPGNRSDAALVMLEYYLCTDNVDETEPSLVWARTLLKDLGV